MRGAFDWSTIFWPRRCRLSVCSHARAQSRPTRHDHHRHETPKDTDDVFDIDGFKYIVDKEFLIKATPIKVDFSEMGFKLDSGIDFGAGCSGCGTESTCG
jgi:hypothetical protein